jgi:hypothetical protein
MKNPSLHSFFTLSYSHHNIQPFIAFFRATSQRHIARTQRGAPSSKRSISLHIHEYKTIHFLSNVELQSVCNAVRFIYTSTKLPSTLHIHEYKTPMNKSLMILQQLSRILLLILCSIDFTLFIEC